MYELVIEGKIVDNEKLFEAQIGIEGGIIKEIKKGGLEGTRRIFIKAGLIFPGFIDPHVHLREDSSHKWDYKEDFKSGSHAAAHGGVTTAIDMPNNFLPTVTEKRLMEKIKLAKKSLIEVLFHGGVSKDYLDELEKMSKHVVGYKVYLSETTGGLALKKDGIQSALTELSKQNLPIVFHADETEATLNELKRVSNDMKLKSHIAHISREVAVNSLEKSKLTYEVTPHHLIFDEDNKNTNITMNPPLGTKKDRLSLLEALKRGRVDFIATDHAPHSLKDKEGGAKGVPNLDVYGNIVAWLIKKIKLDPIYIAKITSYNAAKLFGLKNKGSIREGDIANLSIIQFDSEKINSDNHLTKCGWSPYDGMEFPGKVAYTIYNGEIVYGQ